MVGFVAVHLGAGNYSRSHFHRHEQLARDACAAALEALSSGGPGASDAVAAVASAICVLENSTLTNAGCGSNLNLKGRVECDASVMSVKRGRKKKLRLGGADGQNSLDVASKEEILFGAVAALSDVKNPVRVAELLVRGQENGGNLSCGRIPPSFLVGDEARTWAVENGLSPSSVVRESSEMVSRGARRQFEANLEKLAMAEARSAERLQNGTCGLRHSAENGCAPGFHDIVQVDFDNGAVTDTVGAICIDAYGNVACGASSGGISLKYPGRVGPAACYGAGLWCEAPPGDDAAVACCASGSGEYLMRTLIAERFCRGLIEAGRSEVEEEFDLKKLVDSRFRHSPFLRSVADRDKILGILGVEVYDGRVAVNLFHSSRHMCVGYAASGPRKPVSFVSVLPDDQPEGASSVVWGASVDLRPRKTRK